MTAGSYTTTMIAAHAGEEARAAFLRRTYLHLAGAILAFAMLEAILLNLAVTRQMADALARSGNGWLVVLGLFMVVSWVADKWARANTSVEKQYLGLGLYIVAEAIVFMPLLYIADLFFPNAIFAAAVLTLFMFLGLTTVVLVTRMDFSWMRTILTVGGFVAMGVIIAAILFGFSLGVFFSGAMIFLACGFILYDTSQVLHHYRTDQHVAASLSLFSSVALLFWYVLRLMLSLSSRD